MAGNAGTQRVLKLIQRYERSKRHGNFFSTCATLELGAVGQAWDQLVVDTFPLEVAAYPRVMHHALIETAKARSCDRGVEREQAAQH